jgi:flagellar motor switch protein FliM
MLRDAHQECAASMATSLSAFLQAEIAVSLEEVSFTGVEEFKSAVKSPGCLISFELMPLGQWAAMSLDSAAVFGLLELLLGGQAGAAPPEARTLTEIEWSLLEEVVRMLVASLGETWKGFHPVEFKVQALESDPARLATPNAMMRLARIAFRLEFGGQTGGFEVVAPQTFFDVAAKVETAEIAPPIESIERNLALLSDAQVDVEVILDGPTMAFDELAKLGSGQVVQFDYPLAKPLRVVVNGAISFPCQMVSAGRKRAFQVESAK